MKHFFFLLLCCLTEFSVYSQKVAVTVTGIRSTEGIIRLALFNSQPAFREEKPVWEGYFQKTGIQEGCLNCCIEGIEPGTYGLAVLDDENGNGRLDSKVIVPMEGVGFSNYQLKGIRKPDFDDFSFILPRNVTIRLVVRLKYYL